MTIYGAVFTVFIVGKETPSEALVDVFAIDSLSDFTAEHASDAVGKSHTDT